MVCNCTLIFYGVVTLVILAYLWIKKKYRFFEERGIPFVTPKFPLGNLWGVGSKRHTGMFVREMYSKLKGRDVLGGVFFFIRPVVMPLDLDLIKHILVKDFQYFHDRGIYVNERDDPLSGHLFALSGQRWKHLRTKLSPTFTSGKMKMMHSTIIAVAQEFQQFLGECANKKEEVEIKDILGRFTTDVIGSCAFGVECNSLNDPDTEFRRMGKKVFDFKGFEFLKLFFLSMFPDIGRALHIRATKVDVSEFFMRLLRETIDYREKNNVKRNDFLSLLIQIKNTGKLEGDDVDLGTMSFEELAAQTFLFFIAGFETSSSTMTFALYELAQDQKVQNQAREEVNRILEKYNGQYTYEACMEMKYIDQIIKETLRMHPIVPNLIRSLTKDYTIPDRNLAFKKGTFFSIPVFGIHRDADIYPEPNKFDPDRFTEENIKNRHQYSWLPFGDGPRNCVGMRFGMMQTRVGLATLLSKYRITPTSRTPIPMEYEPTSAVLSPKGGMWLKIEKI
ncbi:cytochrome P450 6A1-like isoform X1 [Lutzomyia longipalpis]|uniref:cytochrome P450 6A1-like isoform X1 n=1 Tax=Lutzomyia longipalpis TaxID=7200 RepID=UPI002483A992|nr:cytochrome P450 6A1-like isoform X1 [Lutzomyia longipalpis]